MNNNGENTTHMYQKYGHTTEYRIKTKASSQTINIHTVYNINIYILAIHTNTYRRRELQNLETRKHKFNFQFAKERTRTNTYIHTHKIHTIEEDTLPCIYIERGRKKYISSWFSC